MITSSLDEVDGTDGGVLLLKRERGGGEFFHTKLPKCFQKKKKKSFVPVSNVIDSK